MTVQYIFSSSGSHGPKPIEKFVPSENYCPIKQSVDPCSSLQIKWCTVNDCFLILEQINLKIFIWETVSALGKNQTYQMFSLSKIG